MLDWFLDALIDSLKMLPFLYIIYLLIELLEHNAGNRFPQIIGKARSIGPLAGSLVGAVPQCGLAAASASLYSGRVITLGTLLSVFLSSSDEMLPIFISEAVPVLIILKILGVKIAIAIVSGYLIDLILSRRQKLDADARKEALEAFGSFDCHCNIFLSALRHMVEIFLYVFVFSFVLNIIIGMVGQEKLSGFLNSLPVIGELIAALVGLIPNCASSVVITQMYIDGIIGAGPLFAGLLVNSGVGTLVLIKTSKSKSSTLGIIALLYGIGVFWGVLIGLMNLGF